MGHYNDDLQAINRTYSNAIKNYDQLTPTLVTFLKDHRIASRELGVNPETRDVLFFPGGQRGGLHSFSGGGGSESGSETKTKSDTTISSNPQPEEKPYLIPHGSDISRMFVKDVTLGDIVVGIKEEIQKLPEPRVVSRVRRTTEKLGVDGMRNIVTRKHRDFRVEDTEKHTVKNTRKHKIVTISLNKTRRTKT
jgi:hypothetical protein